MPKIVDHEERRHELGQAVWRVIRRRGVEGASVRSVAREAGWSPGALRHYFRTQSELLSFAMGLVVDRIERRVAQLPSADDPRRAVERRLQQLLPLDEERRVENDVWFAFVGRALVDPQLRAQRKAVHSELLAACRRALEELVERGRADPVLDLALEAGRLHALIDGLALHTAVSGRAVAARRTAALLARHLDSLA